ncbi:MAG: hypothetical protein CMB80_24645, partial [Flammeovirgaceae bacterium]|nr:hypothetical protein [Flammeovirgaceae bacterium]
MTDYTWTGAVNTSWKVAGNWDVGSNYPGQGGVDDKALIDTGSADIQFDDDAGDPKIGEIEITSGFSGTVTQMGVVCNVAIDAGAENGKLTIGGGTWDTNGAALTVTGACTVGTAGTLNLNGSTVSLGTINVGNGASASMTFSSATTTITLDPNSTHPTWGFSLGAAATVNFNGGTIKFAKVDSGTRYMQMGAEGTHVLNDVIVDTNYDIPWAGFFEAASLDIQDGNL